MNVLYDDIGNPEKNSNASDAYSMIKLNTWII